MIEGEINADNEAVVRLKVRGQDGTGLELPAILDTGFSDFLTLSSLEISARSLDKRSRGALSTATAFWSREILRWA